jgi:YHS domain-containing protein
MNLRSVLVLSSIVLVFAPLSAARSQSGGTQGGTPPGKAAEAPKPASTAGAWKGDPYLLAVDPVTGEPLGPIEKQVKIENDGRELRFANRENADKFQADPKKYLAAVDEKIVRDQKPFYPLDTCVVSGDKLGADAVDLVYKNRLVRLSSREHEATFRKDPAAYVEKLDRAVIAKQGPAYVAKTCPVSSEKLGGEMGDPVDYVIGNRLVRLCCNDCRADLDKDPLKYLRVPERKNETPSKPEEPRKDGGKSSE